MIRKRELVQWEYTCPYCGKVYNFASEKEAKTFKKLHEKTCSYNLDAKRCHTCGYCYLPYEYSTPMCELGLDVTATSPCPKHDINHRPHSKIKVPVMKYDYPLPEYGVNVPKGTFMQYWYGMYVIHHIPGMYAKAEFAYSSDLINRTFDEKHIVWITADAAQQIQKAIKEDQWKIG
jgi:YHS domain-containing protein